MKPIAQMVDESSMEDNARARSRREEATRRATERQEREKDWNGRGANFNAVTGFMSFPPFGGFHFQSGLPELVIQTRPRNERRRRRSRRSCRRRRRRSRLPPFQPTPFLLVTHARTSSPLASGLPSCSLPPSTVSR